MQCRNCSLAACVQEQLLLLSSSRLFLSSLFSPMLYTGAFLATVRGQTPLQGGMGIFAYHLTWDLAGDITGVSLDRCALYGPNLTTALIYFQFGLSGAPAVQVTINGTYFITASMSHLSWIDISQLAPYFASPTSLCRAQACQLSCENSATPNSTPNLSVDLELTTVGEFLGKLFFTSRTTSKNQVKEFVLTCGWATYINAQFSPDNAGLEFVTYQPKNCNCTNR